MGVLLKLLLIFLLVIVVPVIVGMAIGFGQDSAGNNEVDKDKDGARA